MENTTKTDGTEKFFNYVVISALFFLLPGILTAIGYPSFPDFLEKYLGVYGDRSAWTLIAFGIMGLTLIFGGMYHAKAPLIGYLFGFLLIATAVEVRFLGWYRDLMIKIPFLSVQTLNYLCGIFVMFVGIFLGMRQRFSMPAMIISIFILPIAFLVTCQQMNWLRFSNNFDMSLKRGLNNLFGMIDSKYADMSSVKNYVQEIQENENLTEAEKNQKIQELQKKINKMEEDQQTLDSLKIKSKAYDELIKNQNKQLEGVVWCKDAMNTSKMVKDFSEAVRPEQPCVRDYAVSLVKSEAGQYFDTQRVLPGKAGIRQICAFFTHTSSQWKYISDPTMLRDDFFSPADRTIAIGLAGDCDDFSILNASFVEAIGGVSRIMGGQCDQGGHAWAEVAIGTKEHWELAKDYIFKFYNKQLPLNPSIDGNGVYWLPLDWKMGEKSCASHSVEVLYQPKTQLKFR